ncbi:MAG TPA: T9SS type A sorting domain-containing protein [Rhodothermales bacterium]|nr:T9SS type A sorting domain-containing protein [Rhodothermales bacterium]
MRRLLLLSAALCALASTAAAQSIVEYFPLAVGNRWVFEIRHAYEGTYRGTAEWEVTAVTPSGPGGTADFTITSHPVSGPAVSTVCSVVYQIGETEAQYRPDDTPADCVHLPNAPTGFTGPEFWLGPAVNPQTVTIGGSAYPTTVAFGVEQYQIGGTHGGSSWLFARGIGPVGFSTTSRFQTNPPQGTAYTLVYANVGGVVYGSTVATEPPPAGDALAVQVAPNPVRGSAALDVTLPASADVRAAVYDVTGRRVLTHDAGVLAPGRHRLALDATALAPGVYVVRVTAGEATATARLVRAE